MNVVETAEENYFAAWRLLASNAQGGSSHDHDDVLFATTPSPVAFFNSAFVRPHAVVAEQLDAIAAFFGERELPFTVRFRDDDAAAQACEAAGLQSGGQLPVMFADAAAIDGPVDLDVRVVDESLLPAYVATMAAGYSMPVDVLKPMFTLGSVRNPSFAALLGFVDDTPVATAAVVVSGTCAGVYNVGTPAEFRRRGYGEAATRAAVVEGVRRGCTTTTLQASEMGFPIYKRMGYGTVVNWRSYSTPST